MAARTGEVVVPEGLVECRRQVEQGFSGNDVALDLRLVGTAPLANPGYWKIKDQ